MAQARGTTTGSFRKKTTHTSQSASLLSIRNERVGSIRFACNDIIILVNSFIHYIISNRRRDVRVGDAVERIWRGETRVDEMNSFCSASEPFVR